MLSQNLRHQMKHIRLTRSLNMVLVALVVLHSIWIIGLIGYWASTETVKVGTIALFGTGSLGVAIASALALNYYLLQPLRHLSRRTQRLLRGQRKAIALPQTQRRDELGVLARAIARLQKELARVEEEEQQRLEREKHKLVWRQNTWRELEDRLAVLCRCVPHGIAVICAREHIYLEANEKFLELTEYPLEEILGRRSSELELWLEPEQERQLLDKLQNQQSAYNNLSFLRTRTGALKTVLVSAETVNFSGQDCILLATNDISDRTQLEQNLARSQDFLNIIIDSIPFAVFARETAHPSRYILWNRKAEEIFNLSRVQAIGRTAAEMSPPELAAFFEQLQGNSQESGPSERILCTPDRDAVLLSIRELILRDSEGQISHQLYVCEDITERKRSEANLRRQFKQTVLLARLTEAIRSSLDIQSTFKTAAQKIGRAFEVSCCSIHTYTVEPNPQINCTAEYRESAGETAPSIKLHLQNPHLRKLLDDDDATALVDPSFATEQNCGSNGEVKSSALAIRTSYQGQANGVIVLVQCDRDRGWTDEENKLLAAVAAQVGIAIAQARLLEGEKQSRAALAHRNQALAEAKQAAETANLAKSQFLANMSHELRTPLNAILGFTQLMAKRPALAGSVMELSVINRSGEHLLGIINDILELSKIEAGCIQLNENPFNLHRLVEDIVQMLKFKAMDKNIKLHLHYVGEVPQYLKTDESKLRQVLVNLSSNAIKFTQYGQVTLRVSLKEAEELGKGEDEEAQIANDKGQRTKDEGQTIHFEVEDTGAGIAPEELKILFDPFVQTETGRKSQQGTGLGLSISRKFVQLLGGELNVSSTVGQGSCFKFDICAPPAQAWEVEGESNSTKIVGLAPKQPQQTILVVEDVAENRLLLVKMLESVGFSTIEAENGLEAIAQWQLYRPHLIWMDLRMPVLGGLEATRKIRASEQATGVGPRTGVPIIALTANALEEARPEILAAGCNDIVSKPFKEATLLEIMGQWLDVSYTYEQEGKANLNRRDREVAVLEPAALQIMSQDWLERLHWAASSGDDVQALQLLEEIPEDGLSLYLALAEPIENFRLDLISDLTAPLVESSVDLALRNPKS
ncbi:MAG: ATP-binding protein [Cyanobacteriota bacterium]|nr:ATP-binding protein [Cyanobacteriota bacterium]